MNVFNTHFVSMCNGLPVSVQANVSKANVKRSGRNQNRQLMRGKGGGAVR